MNLVTDLSSNVQRAQAGNMREWLFYEHQGVPDPQSGS